MRAAIRLLLALTLLGWGHFALATDYYWNKNCNGNYCGGPYPSAQAVCDTLTSASGTGIIYKWWSPTSVQCGLKYFSDGHTAGGTVDGQRMGDGCTAPAVLDPNTGGCVAPVDCTSKPDIYSAQECTYVESAKLFSCDSVVNYQGCEYVSSPNGTSNCDISTSICVPRYSPSGNPAPTGASECTDTTCAPLPSDPGEAPENCVTNGDSTYCFKDQESGCGTFNGKEGCFETESGCGTFNGTWGCYPTDKDTRNCGYANGEQVCFDPKDPTKQIPTTSPDHPINGGNADGNENNDPKAPGDTSTGAQDGNQGATNEGLNELGDQLGGKIDKTNSLLGGISDKIGELLDGLFGDDYDGSGDGDGEAIGTEAQGFGEQLGQLLGDKTEEIIGDREAEAQVTLENTIPKLVSGKDGIFDPDGPVIASLDFLNDVLPSAYGCNDYVIDFELGDYQSELKLPVCELTRLKPLLEYLVWMITIIGFWKILYSGLRLEDAKANKGGF